MKTVVYEYDFRYLLQSIYYTHLIFSKDTTPKLSCDNFTGNNLTV